MKDGSVNTFILGSVGMDVGSLDLELFAVSRLESQSTKPLRAQQG